MPNLFRALAFIRPLICIALISSVPSTVVLSGETSAASSAAPSARQPLRSQIARLEQHGVLPTLDRSADVRGPDANDNGVRDDIDAYISKLSLTEPQRKAVIQRARSQQSKLLVGLADAKAVQDLSIQSMAATHCMGDAFESHDARLATDLALKIAAITANTPERAQRYIRFMAALSGTSVMYPSGNTCKE